jgi:hypothetical protein
LFFLIVIRRIYEWRHISVRAEFGDRFREKTLLFEYMNCKYQMTFIKITIHAFGL